MNNSTLISLNKYYNYDSNVLNYFLQDNIQIKNKKELDSLPKLSSDSVNKLIELLEKTTNFLENNKIEYWLDGGTLLGACRNNKFIEWDDDVDIAIPLKSYYSIKNLFNTDTLFISDNIKIIEHFNPNIYDKSKPYMLRTYFFDSTEYFIDLIVYQNFEDKKYTGNNIKWIYKYCYLEDEIYPLKQIIFESKPYYIVNNPEGYLNRSYYFWKHLAVVSHSHRKELEFGRDFNTYYWLH